MATYTMELHRAIDSDPAIVTESLAEYPIFDEKYRDGLNKKIIDHYWNQEIGQETVSMFRLALRRKMNEIMPLYNQHYLASQLKYDPLDTIGIKNVTEAESVAKTAGTSTTDATGTSETLSKSDAKSRAVASELPQVQLSGADDYATSAQDNVSGSTTSGGAKDVQSSANKDTSTSEQDAKNTSTTTGFQGNRTALLMQYRASLVNVDMMVIEELQELFMLVWSNGDEFTERTSYYDY
jgi:hypothetical protein